MIRKPQRERLPRKRRSSTFEFRVADCSGFVTVGEYDDGRPGIEEAITASTSLSNAGTTVAELIVLDTPSVPVELSSSKGLLSRARPADAPFCYSCGNEMNRAGSCYVCSACRATSGCS